MNPKSDNSNAVNTSVLLEALPDDRCQYHTRKGRCTMVVSDPSSHFCSDHLRIRQKSLRSLSDVDLSAELTAGLADFKSVEAVNDFLSRLLFLQAEGRIAPRRAAVMIFNCNQLLHSLTAILRENRLAADAAPTTIVWDIPGVSPLRSERD